MRFLLALLVGLAVFMSMTRAQTPVRFTNGVCTDCLNLSTTNLTFCGAVIQPWITNVCAASVSQALILDSQSATDYASISGDVSKNGDSCIESAKRFVCAINLPRCDSATKDRAGICASLCNNYYKNCGAKELTDFRCLDENFADKAKWGIFRGNNPKVDFCTGDANTVNRVSAMLMAAVVCVILFLL